LISEQFDFYHTGIFLLDPARDYAVLQAASSEGGKRMLARQHRLAVGQEGLVGYVARTGQARIALDVGDDAVFFDNPDLPDTRSETALPLRVREDIIGVLDVQSTEAQAFDQDDINVLQTLADQIAVAIQTARLYQQAQESLEAQRRAYGEISQQSWRQMVYARPTRGYQYIGGQIIALQQDRQSDNPELPGVEIPIRLGGQVIGTIKAHKPDQQSQWTEDETELLDDLSEQLSVALESARLYQDTQRRAAQEQIAGQITARMRETLDVESILKTASEQIRAALDLPEVVIRLGDPTVSESGPRS
jgi:GAF domain-containing protein